MAAIVAIGQLCDNQKPKVFLRACSITVSQSSCLYHQRHNSFRYLPACSFFISDERRGHITPCEGMEKSNAVFSLPRFDEIARVRGYIGSIYQHQRQWEDKTLVSTVLRSRFSWPYFWWRGEHEVRIFWVSASYKDLWMLLIGCRSDMPEHSIWDRWCPILFYLHSLQGVSLTGNILHVVLRNWCMPETHLPEYSGCLHLLTSPHNDVNFET